nr:MAG: RNA-dependent RNA polymerase [Botourmiaviridae sp.]
MAWQSIKKALPSSCKCMDRPMLEGVVSGFRSAPPVLPSGYLAFVRRETRRLFYKGWSKKYWERNVLTCSPGLSATVDAPRAHGGLQRGWEGSHERFLSTCLESQPPYEPVDSDLAGELLVVQSAGKPRPLTKFTPESFLLKPLHDSIYDRLRAFRWLSVGDVCSSSLDRAGFKRTDGDVLTSGDYKSATDGLSIEVAEVILSEILAASEVPEHIKQFALKALRPLLYGDFVDGVRPRRGQMMGSYLSFPLLCLQNRFAFLWAFRWLPDSGRSLPCLINGDDILFQSGPRASERWMALVGELGLEVERTKTSVDAGYGSLNSTLLRWSGVHLRVVPTLRWGRLKPQEVPHSLATNFTSWLEGSRGDRRFRAGLVFFRRYLPLLRSVRLTLLELGFRGKLAYRLARMFKLASGVCEFSLPQLTVGHNAVPTELCTACPEAEISPEVIEANDREVAAWKFSFHYRNWNDRARVLDVLRLSSIRAEPLPRFSTVERLHRSFGWECSKPSWSSVLRAFSSS